MTTVATKLALARTEHLNYRAALRDNDPVQLHASLLRAYQLRQEAEAIDPDKHDVAWRAEQVHDSLMIFYREQLAKLDKES